MRKMKYIVTCLPRELRLRCQDFMILNDNGFPMG